MKNSKEPSSSLHRQHLLKLQKQVPRGDISKGTGGCFFIMNLNFAD
jgi:hypothetical protein